jgi:hypothetical protein
MTDPLLGAGETVAVYVTAWPIPTGLTDADKDVVVALAGAGVVGTGGVVGATAASRSPVRLTW